MLVVTLLAKMFGLREDWLAVFVITWLVSLFAVGFLSAWYGLF